MLVCSLLLYNAVYLIKTHTVCCNCVIPQYVTSASCVVPLMLNCRYVWWGPSLHLMKCWSEWTSKYFPFIMFKQTTQCAKNRDEDKDRHDLSLMSSVSYSVYLICASSKTTSTSICSIYVILSILLSLNKLISVTWCSLRSLISKPVCVCAYKMFYLAIIKIISCFNEQYLQNSWLLLYFGFAGILFII